MYIVFILDFLCLRILGHQSLNTYLYFKFCSVGNRFAVFSTSHFAINCFHVKVTVLLVTVKVLPSSSNY